MQVTCADSPSAPAAAYATGSKLGESGFSAKGVAGPEDVASAFTRGCVSALGDAFSSTVFMRMRLYACAKVVEPRPGTFRSKELRCCSVAESTAFVPWACSFVEVGVRTAVQATLGAALAHVVESQECFGHAPATEAMEAMLKKRCTHKEMYILHASQAAGGAGDESKSPDAQPAASAVSMVFITGKYPKGARIGSILYVVAKCPGLLRALIVARGVFHSTPPAHRGNGYGSAATGLCTQMLLDEGLPEVCLFTDLANPTSNKIYQARACAVARRWQGNHLPLCRR